VLATAIIATVIGAEQKQFLLSYDKHAGRARVAAVAQRIDPECEAFLYTPLDGREDPWWYHMDAMWASANRAIPTFNGYSGNQPPHWPFYDIIVRTEAHDRALDEALTRWRVRWRLDARRVCRVSLRPEE
jgi:hypothetical protein